MTQGWRIAAVALALTVWAAPALAQNTLNGLSAPIPLGTKNGSIVITTGNTFQQVLAVDIPGQAAGTVPRNSLTIQNNNTTDSCWLFIGATASATKGTSILLIAGASYTRYFPYLPSDNIAATCASNSDTLYVDTQ